MYLENNTIIYEPENFFKTPSFHTFSYSNLDLRTFGGLYILIFQSYNTKNGTLQIEKLIVTLTGVILWNSTLPSAS